MQHVAIGLCPMFPAPYVG